MAGISGIAPVCAAARVDTIPGRIAVRKIGLTIQRRERKKKEGQIDWRINWRLG
jgi:hypothetical protein